MWGGSRPEDHYDLFIAEKMWVLGWGEKEQPLQVSRFRQVRPGDRIAIKKKHGRGEIQIRATGVVKGSSERDGRFMLHVDWKHKDIEIITAGRGCFSTIHGPYPKYPKDAIEKAWLKTIFDLPLFADILHRRKSLIETTVQAMREARVGQGPWRQMLLRQYANKCCLSGVTNNNLLIASHILPWSECHTGSQRLDPNNGLLLNAMIDKAFDSKLITFDQLGNILYSPRLTQIETRLMGIKTRRFTMTEEMQKYFKRRNKRIITLNSWCTY